MKIKLKLLFFLLMISIFVSCLVEKFVYPNISFQIERSIIAVILVMLFMCLIIYGNSKNNQKKYQTV